MSQYAAEMLTPQQVVDFWADIRPLLAESCMGNELTETTLTPEHILGLAATDRCAVIGFVDSGRITLVLVIQFVEDNGNKAASILAFAGENMMLFKRLYWDYVVQWLKANGVKYLDTYANERMAKIFNKKFGFSESSVCLRMPIEESSDG